MPHARGVPWARFRVAVALVAAAAILSVLVYLLTGGTLLQEKATLYLYLPDATGVGVDTPVRVNGTDVGKVGAADFSGSTDPNRAVRLTLRVEREHLPDIPFDSGAQIGSEGAVGDRYVDIAQGKSRRRIAPGEAIQYHAQPELLKTLDVQQFADRAKEVDSTLQDIEQGRGRVGQLVVGAETYNDLLRKLTDADRGFREAVSPNNSVGRLVTSDQDYRRMQKPLEQIDSELERIQAGQGSLGRLLREDGQYNYYRDQAAALGKSVADFRKQPFLTSDDLYAGWNKSLNSLIREVDQFNASSGFSTSLAYDNLTGAMRQMQTSVRDFRQNPKKYLRIQLF